MTLPDRRELAVLAALGLGLSAFHLWWWARHRAGMPFFIDEAGYLDFAVDHAAAIRSGSLASLRDSLDLQTPAAPLVPLLTSLGILAADRPVGAAAATAALTAAALVVSAWFLARWFLPPRWALLAAGAVGALPTVLTLTGTYYFACAASAAFTMGVGCLFRSRWGARQGWAVAAGIAFGLAALARTMVIGFFPVVASVAAIGALTVVDPSTLGRRAAGLAAGAVGAMAVMASWYVPNLDGILDYLASPPVRSGIGGPRAGGGTGALDVPGMRDLRLLLGDLLLPMSVVLAAGCAMAAWGWWHGGLRRDTDRSTHRPGGLALVALVAGAALVLVASSQAVGQWMPALPAGIVATLVVVHRWAPMRARGLFVAAIAVVSVVHVAAVSRLVGPLDGTELVSAGPLGRLAILDNRSLLEDQLVRVLEGDHLDEAHRGVPPLLESMASTVRARARQASEPPVVLVVDGHDPLVNVNVIELADDLTHGSSTLVVGALPVFEPRTASEWATELAAPAVGQPNALITFDSEQRRGLREVAYRGLIDALPAIGFERVLEARLPDGRSVGLWWRARSAMTGSQRVAP